MIMENKYSNIIQLKGTHGLCLKWSLKATTSSFLSSDSSCKGNALLIFFSITVTGIVTMDDKLLCLAFELIEEDDKRADEGMHGC